MIAAKAYIESITPYRYDGMSLCPNSVASNEARIKYQTPPSSVILKRNHEYMNLIILLISIHPSLPGVLMGELKSIIL